jgi:phenylpropionate dioxygenase-like ring-hydroxylating dioxygenase large terminal subunit
VTVQDDGLAAHQVTGMRRGTTRFPQYDAAVLGFEQFWYPVLWSRDLTTKPVALTLFGQPIVFVRDGSGTARALQDRCPHRGVPLSLGRCEFPSTITCRYHGWTFDLTDGKLVAVLTDGPDSPICGKAHVRTYAVEECAGLIWIYNGSGTPRPLREQIPAELLDENLVLEGRITTRRGDWRYAAENGFDEGHVKYLHRDAWIVTFTHIPSYVSVNVGPDDANDPWITRNVTGVHFEAEYPGLGVWPKKRLWKHKKRGVRVSIRMPGMLRVQYDGWTHFETYVPTVAGEHRYVQIAMTSARGVQALRFRLFYRGYLSWIFHGQFNDQDTAMVEQMKTPPELLYRPDISLIAWRRLCEAQLGGTVELNEQVEGL